MTFFFSEVFTIDRCWKTFVCAGNKCVKKREYPVVFNFVSKLNIIVDGVVNLSNTTLFELQCSVLKLNSNSQKQHFFPQISTFFPKQNLYYVSVWMNTKSIFEIKKLINPLLVNTNRKMITLFIFVLPKLFANPPLHLN